VTRTTYTVALVAQLYHSNS